MLVQRETRGRRSCLGQGLVSRLSPLSFSTASPKDAGASAGGEERALPGLENSLVLSKLGETGEWPPKPCCGDTGLCSRPKRRWRQAVFVPQALSSSRYLGASTKCPARAATRSGCEMRRGACEPGLSGTRYVTSLQRSTAPGCPGSRAGRWAPGQPPAIR